MEKKIDEDKLANVEIYGYANIQQYKTEVGFRTLVEGVEDNLYVVPDFQRVYRWTEEQVENLAVSLIRGMPIPPIYAYRNKENQLEILDGQQRILSMFFYYIGKYTKKVRNNQIKLQSIYGTDKPFQEALEEVCELKDKCYIMRYNDIIDGETVEREVDITYSRLPKDVKRKLDYTPITVIEINIDDYELQKRYLYKIFANLNSGGTPLTNQELRNGIYKSDFYDMLFVFNTQNEKWRKLYGNEDKFSKDVEDLLRLCAFKHYIECIGEDFTIKDYKNITKLLDDFSENAISFNDKTIREYKRSLENFVDIFPNNFSKRITLWESIFIVMDKKKLDIDITADICSKIMANPEYKDTVKDGTGSKSLIEKRLKAVYNELFKNAR